MEQKKKSRNYIIPTTFFTSLPPCKPVTFTKGKETDNTITNETSFSTKSTRVRVLAKEEKPLLKNVKRRTSALSLKSIHQKKEFKHIDKEDNHEHYPKSLFSYEQLKDVWKKYYFKLQELGEQSMAAIIASDEPKLYENFQVGISVPNDFMKSQVEKGKPELLKFLREKLNNYEIQVMVNLNETIEKKFVYTTHEKYEKLKEKNPLIEKLRTTFRLDL